MVFSRSLLVALLACVVSAAPLHAENKDKSIGMVTGPKTGTYIAMGRDIAGVAKTAGQVIQVKDSDGSIDNIRRITSDENAALGIVQSDVLGFLKRSKNRDSQRISEELRMVFPLAREEVHLIARNEIKTIADLQGKRVVVGDEGSGSLLTSMNLLSMMNIAPGQTLKIAPPEGLVAVLKNEADAMIFVGGKPVRLFKNLEDLKKSSPENAALMDQVHFVPLNDSKMLQEYAPAEINSNDYSFVNQAVPTLAVTAVLVSYDFSDPEDAYHKQRCKQLRAIGNAMRDHLDYLRSSGHPKWKEVDLNAEVSLWKRDLCSWKKPAEAAKAAPSPNAGLQNDLLGVIKRTK